MVRGFGHRKLKQNMKANTQIPVFNTIPNGWVIVSTASTTPVGYRMISNNKSRFGGERKLGLIKEF